MSEKVVRYKFLLSVTLSIADSNEKFNQYLGHTMVIARDFARRTIFLDVLVYIPFRAIKVNLRRRRLFNDKKMVHFLLFFYSTRTREFLAL